MKTFPARKIHTKPKQTQAAYSRAHEFIGLVVEEEWVPFKTSKKETLTEVLLSVYAVGSFFAGALAAFLARKGAPEEKKVSLEVTRQLEQHVPV